MTREDDGSYGKKHSGDREVNPEIAKAVEKKAPDKKMTCAASFKIAEDLDVTPLDVGFTLDSFEIKIVKCQMGIFGYGSGDKPLKAVDSVEEELKKAIEGELREGMLSCKSAWEIAERLDVSRMEVTSACNFLKIKISPCQLGAF
jgi:hypothetical protein